MGRHRPLGTTGSSPRVWGTRHVPISPQPRLRFIPTRVGNSIIIKFKRIWKTVHPHACGELSRMFMTIDSVSGSSPRVWGTLYIIPSTLHIYRFIPTRVGNSTACRLYQQCQPVHPHACGELTTFRLTESTSCGSSPRVWGTQLTGADDIDNRRFIPTRVGNSCFLAMMMCYLSVHPHACGELPRMKIGIISFTGSSPRVWGTRQNRENRYRLCRFIPTRVGNSLSWH